MPYEQTEVSDTLAFSAMHDRLVDWGLCWLRAGRTEGGGREVIVEIEPGQQKYRKVMEWYVEGDADKKPRKWTRPEIEAAGRLHSRVIRMPLAQRLVLQVFYAETIAPVFHELEPDEQATIIRDLTNWRVRPFGVNKRIEVYNRDFVPAEKPIHWSDFMPIRDRGIRMLVNGERMLP